LSSNCQEIIIHAIEMQYEVYVIKFCITMLKNDL